MKYALVDTVVHDWPMGLIMINVVPHVDEDGVATEQYEVVDGQQRLVTLFEYRDGARWGPASHRRSEGSPFSALAHARQDRFDEYKVSVALMREFEQSLDLAVASAIVYLAISLRGGEPITSPPYADGHMPNNATMYSRLKSALDRRIV